MTAPASITITPVLVVDLLAEGERSAVYRAPKARRECALEPSWSGSATSIYRGDPAPRCPPSQPHLG
jgi:hypothetical protein